MPATTFGVRRWCSCSNSSPRRCPTGRRHSGRASSAPIGSPWPRQGRISRRWFACSPGWRSTPTPGWTRSVASRPFNAASRRQAARSGPTDRPEVLRILLSIDPHDQIRYLERLADGAQAANIRHLDLSWTGVTDLGPLERLTGLQSLDLAGTGVTDLGPLERLTGLQLLNLAGTG